MHFYSTRIPTPAVAIKKDVKRQMNMSVLFETRWKPWKTDEILLTLLAGNAQMFHAHHTISHNAVYWVHSSPMVTRKCNPVCTEEVCPLESPGVLKVKAISLVGLVIYILPQDTQNGHVLFRCCLVCFGDRHLVDLSYTNLHVRRLLCVW